RVSCDGQAQRPAAALTLSLHDALPIYLAEEVPTEENGGVSEDGLTVTYTLREGVTWSDGEPLTAEDLAFTVDVAQDPDGAALPEDRKSTRLNSSHVQISYAVFCLNKQK